MLMRKLEGRLPTAPAACPQPVVDCRRPTAGPAEATLQYRLLPGGLVPLTLHRPQSPGTSPSCSFSVWPRCCTHLHRWSKKSNRLLQHTWRYFVRQMPAGATTRVPGRLIANGRSALPFMNMVIPTSRWPTRPICAHGSTWPPATSARTACNGPCIGGWGMPTRFASMPSPARSTAPGRPSRF